MFGLISAATCFALPLAADPWSLAPNFTKGESAYALTLDVDAGGQQIQAEMTLKRKISVIDGEKVSGTVTLADIMVSGSSPSEDLTFDAGWGKRGQILYTTGEFDDGVRRMLAPMVFVYPETPVVEGDKWKFVMEPKSDATLKATYEFEAKAIEKVSGEDAMKVLLKYGEETGGGTSSKSTFWVNQKGVVVKFEAEIKDWIVPMAGPGPVTASIKGTLKK